MPRNKLHLISVEDYKQFEENLKNDPELIKTKDDNGDTIVHIAAREKNIKLLVILKPYIKNNADIKNTLNEAFNIALDIGDYHTMKLISELGADIEQLDDKKSSNLHRMIEGGDFLRAKYLIYLGANIHAENLEEITPLQLVAELHTDPKWWNLLLKRGAGIFGKLFNIENHKIVVDPNELKRLTSQHIIFRTVLCNNKSRPRINNKTPGFEDCCFDTKALRSAVLSGKKLNFPAIIASFNRLAPKNNDGESYKIIFNTWMKELEELQKLYKTMHPKSLVKYMLEQIIIFNDKQIKQNHPEQCLNTTTLPPELQERLEQTRVRLIKKHVI